MSLQITLPLGKEDTVKNLVFSILTNEYPLKIVELTNLIRKRYGKSVTFQAVRKAILELVKEGVLVQNRKEFLINKKWIFETKASLDKIYSDLMKEKISPKNIDSIQGEVSVFIFDSLNDLIKFWQKIIDDWYTHFKRGDQNINAYQGMHIWEALLHPDTERNVMGKLRKKGIISYSVSSIKTPLDKYVWKFYKNVGIKVGVISGASSFDKTYYVGTYGETIVQAYYPKRTVEDLDKFFKKNKTMEDLNLQQLSEIVNRKMKVRLTVIKNISMAKQINNSIISQID